MTGPDLNDAGGGGIRLRPPQRADALALARVCDMADDGLPRPVWLADEAGYARFIVADRAGACVGGVLCYPLPVGPDPEAEARADFVPLCRNKQRVAGGWYIDVIACLPEARGIGLGRRLLRAAIDRAQEAGAGSIALQVLSENHAAQALYLSEGFEVVAEERLAQDLWRPGSDRVLAMRRVL